MSIALTYSVAGMQAASERLSIRAANVANVNTPDYKAVEVDQVSTESGPVVSARPAIDTAQLPVQAPAEKSEPSDVSLEYELTDMIAAEHAYKASAAVARTVGQVQESLLDIFT